MPSQFTPDRSADAPQLTEAYTNAQWHYFFASLVLAYWGPSGIAIDIKETLGINLNKGFLFAVVLFCGYKMTIEWLQCGPERNKVAKIDYWFHHLLAIAAIVFNIWPTFRSSIF